MRLRWFPRCNIEKKRKFIRELVVDLSKGERAEAVRNYKAKREKLMQEKKDNESEYDEIDMEDFKEHIEDVEDMDSYYPESQEDKHRMLLDFYMNPNYNKYELL